MVLNGTPFKSGDDIINCLGSLMQQQQQSHTPAKPVSNFDTGGGNDDDVYEYFRSQMTEEAIEKEKQEDNNSEGKGDIMSDVKRKSDERDVARGQILKDSFDIKNPKINQHNTSMTKNLSPPPALEHPKNLDKDEEMLMSKMAVTDY
jgi:hypothetical protein